MLGTSIFVPPRRCSVINEIVSLLALLSAVRQLLRNLQAAQPYTTTKRWEPGSALRRRRRGAEPHE